MEYVRLCFERLAREYAITESQIAQWINFVEKHYSEAHRHYHTLEHIRSMFGCLTAEEVSLQIQNRDAIELAIIFHDIIYDTASRENELNSIKVFEAFAKEISLPEELRNKVSQLIERTVRHELQDGDDIDAKIFLDTDLEVLSRGAEDYSLYSNQIRTEYGQFSNEQYCKGRIKVLKAFLERPNLYFSDAFTAREERARFNLAQEIARLEEQLIVS